MRQQWEDADLAFRAEISAEYFTCSNYLSGEYMGNIAAELD